MPRSPPAAFSAFGYTLHQDALVGIRSIDQLAARCVGSIPPADQPAVRAYLEAALDELTGAEIKGVLRRAAPDLAFDARSSRALFATVARLLREAGSDGGSLPT